MIVLSVVYVENSDFYLLGQLVENPGNANLGLKVNRRFNFSCFEMFSLLMFCVVVKYKEYI